MSVRCLECGTLLIREAVARNEAVQRTVDVFDGRMSMGYGGLAGFVIGMGSWFVLSQDQTIVKGWLLVSIITGTVLGRLIAWLGRHKL